MAPSAIFSPSDDLQALPQQQYLSISSYQAHPSKLVTKHDHAVDLSGEINGDTARDVPYTNARESDLNPGIARANVVATLAAPYGTTDMDWAEKHKHQTPLQQHVTYWDTDNDGVIWPTDTYHGCRRFGWSPPLSFVAALIINLGLSYATCPTYIPDPLFRIFVSRIHRDKHGSGSLTYDNQGRFRPQAFEEFLASYDRGSKGGLDKGDLWAAWRGQRNAFDPFGWSAFALEWTATWLLIWPADGVMRKEEIRRVYDGSIFEAKAREFEARQRRGRG